MPGAPETGHCWGYSKAVRTAQTPIHIAIVTGACEGRTMTDLRFDRMQCGDVALNVAMLGDKSNPLILCLHGFPEYWAAWQGVADRLADDFFIVMPDQRGFNLSDKPQGQEAYRAKYLVADIASLADQISPDKPFILAGHDWGASVAYAYAFAHPERVSKLVIANGMHPVCFQRALLKDAEQRTASQYFHILRSERGPMLMAEDNYRRTMNMLEGFSKAGWMTPEIKSDYQAAWSQPNAIESMLYYYSSSPVVVPKPDEAIVDAPLLNVAKERVMVRMPHLVIWGEADEALRPVCLEGLDEFAADLTIQKVPDAGHWILHEKPDEVTVAIRAFVSR